MSKHKYGKSWVIVNKHNAALMTYEYEAYFFTDKPDNTYYNIVESPDAPIDIWTVTFSSKQAALDALKEFKEEYSIVGPLQDKYNKKIELTEEEQALCEKYPSYDESFEGCIVTKSYGYCYCRTEKDWKRLRNARSRNRARGTKS